jgi:hypothetical protein
MRINTRTYMPLCVAALAVSTTLIPLRAQSHGDDLNAQWPVAGQNLHDTRS